MPSLDIIGVRLMMFSATLSNISVISWQSVLLVEGTGVPVENHWPARSHWQTLSHNVVSRTPRLSGIRTYNVSGDVHYVPIRHNRPNTNCKLERSVCLRQIWMMNLHEFMNIQTVSGGLILNILCLLNNIALLLGKRAPIGWTRIDWICICNIMSFIYILYPWIVI